MARALITGISGFTGKYLTDELLAHGYDVYGLSHESSDLNNNIFCANLNSSMEVDRVINEVRPELVFHLAAISFVAHNDAGEIYNTNVVGTRNLLQALADNGHSVQSVILASSANIYGNTTVDPITEAVQPSPQNDYAISKLAMEYAAGLWLDKLPITIVRPFNYTGVGQSKSFLIPKIVDHFRQDKRVIELGNTDIYRDFSDVRDVARVYLKLAEEGTSGQVFNVCSGTAYSLEYILKMMEQIAGYRIKVDAKQEFIRKNEVRRLRGSNSKLIEVVGGFTPTPLEQTLKWMFEAAPG